MNASLKQYQTFGTSQVYFPKRDHKKISRMKGPITLVSTVCPDYPNDGKTYTFFGKLGTGISLTSWEHLNNVPALIKELKKQGIEPNWHILLADLPELTDGQTEFFHRVADSKEAYLNLCEQSARAIQAEVGSNAKVMTFSEFYGNQGIDYLEVQEKTCAMILQLRDEDRAFDSKFSIFRNKRVRLAQLFRGQRLSKEEMDMAAAHGMSLYATHGTLLRHIFDCDRLVVVNHDTANLRNFFLWNVVPGGAKVEHMQNFPVGILDGTLY
jgi:hypothetical protein